VYLASNILYYKSHEQMRINFEKKEYYVPRISVIIFYLGQAFNNIKYHDPCFHLVY